MFSWSLLPPSARLYLCPADVPCTSGKVRSTEMFSTALPQSMPTHGGSERTGVALEADVAAAQGLGVLFVC